MELSALIKRDTKKLSSSSIPLSLPPSPFLKLSHLSSLSLFLSLSLIKKVPCKHIVKSLLSINQVKKAAT
jgi:hypothetical protein